MSTGTGITDEIPRMYPKVEKRDHGREDNRFQNPARFLEMGSGVGSLGKPGDPAEK